MKDIKRICEWTGQEFYVDFKHRNQRFIDKNAMYSWRKNQNREMVKCLKCGKDFERYKNILHPTSGKPTQYCSNDCNKTSIEKREKLKRKRPKQCLRYLFYIFYIFIFFYIFLYF